MSEAIAIYQVAREVKRMYKDAPALRITHQIQAARRSGIDWLDWSISTLRGIDELPPHKLRKIRLCYDHEHQTKRQPVEIEQQADRLLNAWYDSLPPELIHDGLKIIYLI